MDVTVGGIIYTLPKQPEKNLIDGHDLPKKQQKFKRVDHTHIKDLPDDEQVEFIVRELKRRQEGYWFMCNGVATYITGAHYFYLTYWYIGSMYPDYRDCDRLYYYFWDYCVKDNDCYGMIFLTNRRNGKTERALSEMYEVLSRTENSLGGIQERTDEHARKTFGKLVRSWKRLPDFLKPLDVGESDPKSRLDFSEPSVKSTKNKKSYKKALNSSIDYGPSKEEHYDGAKLLRYFRDETGKTVAANIEKCWEIVKECLALGPNIIGKAILPTTVEELEKKGGKNFMKLYNDSAIHVRDDNGRTTSGLYPFFKPAYVGLEGFIDEYGASIEDDPAPNEIILGPTGKRIIQGSKTFLLNKRKNLKGSGLASEKRKFPFTEEEAFDVVFGDIWEADVKEILKHVRTQLMQEAPNVTLAKIFEVGGEIKTNVITKEEGAVKIVEWPKPNVIYKGGFDGAASDKETGSDEGSNVAFVILKGFAGMEELNYAPVCSFSIRPEKLEDAYLTVLLLCRLYNVDDKFLILGETNAGQGSPVVAYFANRGHLNLIMKKPKNLGFNYNDKTDKYWIYRNGAVKDLQIILANKFLRRYAHNIRILSLIDSLIKIGTENADEADAFLMCILAFGDFDKADAKVYVKKPKMIPVRKRDPQGRNIIVWEAAK